MKVETIKQAIDSIQPTGETKDRILDNIIIRKNNYNTRSVYQNYRYYIYCRIIVAVSVCLIIIISSIVLEDSSTMEYITIYETGTDREITTEEIKLTSGYITGNGNVTGQLIALQLKGEDIKYIYFVSEYQPFKLYDGLDNKTLYWEGLEVGYEVEAGKDREWILEWWPEETIKWLKENTGSGIRDLPRELVMDTIFLKIILENGNPHYEAIHITIGKDGFILVKSIELSKEDYEISFGITKE